jgi:hypothetical protein
MSTMRRSLTYSNIVATIALVIAAGLGTAYAATELAPKSVGARELRPGAVTADKLRKNAVTAPKLEAAAVKQGKIANGAVTTEKIAANAVSSAKLPGGVITTDKVGDDAITGAKVNESSLSQVPSAAASDFAAVADTANPEAFAKVSPEGAVFPGDSKGIDATDVTNGKFPGIYCIEVPFTPKGAQVTPEYASNNNVTVYVKFGGTDSCEPPKVEIRNYNAGNLQKGPFYVVFYR